MTAGPWTAADAAELDVAVHELVRCYWQHRATCEACQPCAEPSEWRAHHAECWKCQHSIRAATGTFGEPCERYVAHLEHGRTCVQCNPCPHVRAAIEHVVDWRDARDLRSRAEHLRAEQNARAA